MTSFERKGSAAKIGLAVPILDCGSHYYRYQRIDGAPSMFSSLLGEQNNVGNDGVMKVMMKTTMMVMPGGGVRGYSQKNWVGVCGLLPETLTLFQTKICDFLYPISNLTKNLILISDLFQLLHGWCSNLRKAFVDGLIA